MQDGDHVPGLRTLEVLIAFRNRVVGKAAGGIGQKHLGLYFRVHRLAVDLVEGKPEDKRTEIVDIGHPPEVVAEAAFSVEANVFPALLYGWEPDPAVQHPKIVQIHEGSVTGTGAEFTTLGPTADRVVLGTEGGIHAAINGPIHRFPKNVAFAGGAPEIGDQQTGLPFQVLDRVSGEGKIEHRNALDPESAVVDLCISTDIDRHFMGTEFPLGTGQLARCNRPVVHDVVVRAGLFD